MPILEFYSPDTHTIYQFLARSLADAGRLPRCPDGGASRMEKLVSSFAITGRAKETSGVESGGEEFTPAQEAALMRLTSQMEGLSEENPDPRQVGRLMREMTDILGKDKVPGEMDEMIRRLEGGEDVEKLEDEYGDLMGGDAPEMQGGNVEDAATASSRLRRALRQRQPARRDPALYEMRDYV